MILQSLSENINETVNLTALDGNEIIYLDRIESNWPYRIHLPVGSHLPLHCTAAGKLFLANMNTGWQQRYLKAANLSKYTSKTITDVKELRGEYLDGMIALAVPVKNELGDVCYSIAVHAPSARIGLDDLKEYLPQLNEAALKISELECQELNEA
ncbi:putative transcriptional regulator SauR [Nymphon striatum]|nr:putative transcriptional regulator SauR [Nymphon striatum]